jgi:two-component system nitrate/nitrite sensor histidine kinase NarX
LFHQWILPHRLYRRKSGYITGHLKKSARINLLEIHCQSARTSLNTAKDMLYHKPVAEPRDEVDTGPDSWQRCHTRKHLVLPIAIVIAVLALLAISLFAEVPFISANDLKWLQAGLLLTSVLLVGLTLYRVSQHIIQPLDELRKWSRRIRAGDLHTHIPRAGSGEYRVLVDDINLLTNELNTLTEEMDNQVRAQIEQIANKSRSLEILYDIATSLSEAHNPDELMDQFLDTLMILVDARAASIRLISENKNTFLVASRGLSESVVEQEKSVPMSRCLCGRIAQHGGIGIQQGINPCNQYLHEPMLTTPCAELVVVPIQYQDRILGVYNLFLDRPASDLGKDAKDLLSSIGKHLGLALEKTRLDDNARRLAVMEERNMLGNELHDSLAQSLVSMRLQTKMLGEILHKKDFRAAQNEVRNLKTAVDEAHSSLRELMANFRFRLSGNGLYSSIEDLVSRFKQETGIKTYLQNTCDAADGDISPVQEVQAFRIVQEAFTNIRKHSNASNVRVLMFMDHGECNILIEDDGEGVIDANSENGGPGEHIGLSIMNERARRMQGKLTIESEAGEGTRVHLRFPSADPEKTIRIAG